MPRCDVCGNDYDKTFTVTMGDKTWTFDCFECAVHALAPTCAECGTRIIGHGSEVSGTMYCCAHCAHQNGGLQIQDRTEEVTA